MNRRDRARTIIALTALIAANDGDITVDGSADADNITLDFGKKVSCMFRIQVRESIVVVHWFNASENLNPAVFRNVNAFHHRKATTTTTTVGIVDNIRFYANAIFNGDAFLTS